MKFGVLGPLEVRRDDVAIAVAGTKPRKLLARLLIDANTVVSVDALVDAVWGPEEAQPERSAAAIQVYVSNLRRALGPDVIRTAAPGYVLDLDGHACDAHELADCVAAARSLRTEGHLDGAIAAARRATALPRGEPYADVGYEDWAQATVPRAHRESAVGARGAARRVARRRTRRRGDPAPRSAGRAAPLSGAGRADI